MQAGSASMGSMCCLGGGRCLLSSKQHPCSSLQQLCVLVLLAAAACLSTATQLRSTPDLSAASLQQQAPQGVPAAVRGWAQWRQRQQLGHTPSILESQQQLQPPPRQQPQQQQASWLRRLLGTVKFPGPNDPTLKPYSALPKHFQMKWFEVFKQQWQDYHAGLQAVKIGDKSLLDLAAPLLLQNTTLVNPAQLRRSIGHMGGMHRLRRWGREQLQQRIWTCRQSIHHSFCAAGHCSGCRAVSMSAVDTLQSCQHACSHHSAEGLQLVRVSQA